MADKKIDKIFGSNEKVSDFSFNERVADVFDDMVSRSVPMYKETMLASVDLGKHFIKQNTNIIDIGCSTGTLLNLCSQTYGGNKFNFIGIDSSQAMLNKAKNKIKGSKNFSNIKFKHQDIEKSIDISNASLIFMNYTLQFVRPLNRQKLIKEIHKGLNENGAFILIEKVLGNDSLFNRIYIDLYFKYKSSVGYSDKEIKKKREALENVLIPYRIDENIELLKSSGFESVDIFFKWFNWCGIVAIKKND